jgi:tetratricopeptide (TPR) repeat protein
MKCDTIQELERYLQLQEMALGKVSPEVAVTLSKLANLYAHGGNYEKSELLHNRALEIRMGVDAPNQSEVEDSRRSLHRVREMRKKSEKLSKLKGKSKIGDTPSGRQISRSDQGTSEAHKKQASPDVIKEMELEVALLKQMVGPDHPAVADSLTKLADLYCRAKLYDNMESILVESLRIRETVCGPQHLKVANELKNLAQLYFALERYEQAEPLFERAIAIRETTLGTTHPKVTELANLYAKLLKKTNRIKQAEELENHIAQARDRKGAEQLA